MCSEPLILGVLQDFITGETLDDTLDERHRQKIEKLLVEEKGYLKEDIQVRKEVILQINEKQSIVKIDILVKLNNKICMIIQYGPGSLVSRERSVLAASRVVTSYQIPVAVVTNGEDAEIIDCQTTKIKSKDLKNIPSKTELTKISKQFTFPEILPKKAEMEARILYAFEVDGSCSCC